MLKQEYRNIYENEGDHFFYTSTHQLVLQLLNQNLTSTNPIILDAGCGTGLLAKKMEQFGKVWGLDSSDEAIKLSKSQGLRNIKKGSINRLPFKDNSFDVVVSIDVLYHQNVDDLKAISEFRRVLKSSGLLIIKVPAFEFLRGNHDLVVQTKQRYTVVELTEKLQKFGFSVTKSSYFFMFIFPYIYLKRALEKLSPSPISEIEQLPFITNYLAKMVTSIELLLMRLINLPFGVSLVSVARKIK